MSLESPEEDYSDAIAVKISAPRLRTELIGSDPEVWISFRNNFNPGDGVPVYHVSELRGLASVSNRRLLFINEAKKVMPGAGVMG